MDREKQPSPDIDDLGAEQVPGSGFEHEEPEPNDKAEEEA
jgi:hypothetical protein